jgi:hypothetical protein
MMIIRATSFSAALKLAAILIFSAVFGCSSRKAAIERLSAPIVIPPVIKQIENIPYRHGRIRYHNEPRTFQYNAIDFSDLTTLLAHLESDQITHVTIYSEFKLIGKGFLEIVERFHSSGIAVAEFWVPTGARPGRAELMQAYQGQTTNR